MKKSWRIRDIDEFASVINEFEDVCKKAIDKEPHLITVAPLTEAKISAAQRKTYFMWLGEWEKESGQDREDSHITFKEKFLIPIYLSGPESEFYSRIIKKLRWLRDKVHPKYHELKRQFLEEDVSIMDASTAEMSEYMNAIKNFLASEFRFAVSDPSMKGLI